MKLVLIRDMPRRFYTLGTLNVNGELFCYTLEDEVREGPKVPGKTAIPYGTYKVIVDYSLRFKRLMPLLIDVPNFTGIRIHPGNTAEDTEGCILVGQDRREEEGTLVGSRSAFNELFGMLQAELVHDRVSIEIRRY